MDEELILVDHGLTGTNRARHGPRAAVAAVRMGDALVVGTLDRLARSQPDARDIADGFTAKGSTLRPVRRSDDPAALVAARSTLTGAHLAAYVGA